MNDTCDRSSSGGRPTRSFSGGYAALRAVASTIIPPATITLILAVGGLGCANRKVDKCNELSAQAHVDAEKFVALLDSHGGTIASEQAEQGFNEIDDVLAREEKACGDADLPAKVKAVRAARVSLTKLFEQSKTAAEALALRPQLPEDPPPIFHATAEWSPPVLEARLAADKTYLATWEPRNRSTLNAFLTFLSQVLATMDINGTANVDQRALEAVQKAHLYSSAGDAAVDDVMQFFLRTGTLPTDFQSRLGAHLDATASEPHLGTWIPTKAGKDVHDYSAVAAWMRRSRPEYVREFLAEKIDGPHHWSDLVSRDPKTGIAQPPLRPWLARERATLAWLASITTLLPQENARAQQLAASALGDEPPDLVDIDTLLSEYRSNEVRADNEFKAHVIELTGVARDIKKNALEHIYIVVSSGREYESPEVHCQVPDRLAKEAASYSKGDKLTVRGRVRGMVLMAVVLDDCEFVD